MCANFAQFGVNKYIFTFFFFSFHSVQHVNLMAILKSTGHTFKRLVHLA